MTIASIDIGSNTILLLIAKVEQYNNKIIPILNEYRMPRLGKGLKPGGKISGEKIERLIEILTGYKKIIEFYRVDKIILTATNAFRLAANSKEIVQIVKSKFGYDINIISGEEEAEYAFLGALSAFESNDVISLVIDIGGGSTELILGNENSIEYRKSFQTGSVSATEYFLINTPPIKDDIENLNRFLNLTFSEIKNKLSPERSIAIAGTPTTISCMIQNIKHFDEGKIEGSTINYEALKILTGKLVNMTPPEIKETFGEIMHGREDIILAGAFILLQIMELLSLSEVIVSSRGIRYGAIAYYLKSTSQ
ncbi:exopolyphosphatase [bacterium BMS3Abin03]|nr:exopolyphosphatase [bacterium BMS3Abin03]